LIPHDGSGSRCGGGAASAARTSGTRDPAAFAAASRHLVKSIHPASARRHVRYAEKVIGVPETLPLEFMCVLLWFPDGFAKRETVTSSPLSAQTYERRSRHASGDTPACYS
jgi:hypothetical protein